MSLIVELSAETLARLSRVLDADSEFASLVTSTIDEHREILDTLAST